MGSQGANGRGFARRHKRVPCDLLVAGRAYKGFATRLAPHEMFIQLSGSSLPRRGSDVLIQLRPEGTGACLEIEAIVTRQQLTEVGEHGIHRGVELRIQGAPPEYHSMFVDPALREDTTEVELLIELDLAEPDLPAPRDFANPPSHADPVRVGAALEAESEPDHDWPIAHVPRPDPTREPAPGRDDSDLPRSRLVDPGPAADSAPVQPEIDDSERPLDYDTESRITREPPRAHPLRAANAIVVYDGDRLKDVYDLLEQLGARPERARLTGPTRFRGWSLPPRLLVVDAQDALSLDWPQNLIADGVVRIAVASAASAVIGKILRGQGFHYLIRRPVHPRALELLFRLVLHRGPERRKLLRSTLGIDARLVTSPWRWAAGCTLLELSPLGCRVVTRQDIPLLSTVTLRTSRAVTGSRPISLAGRVVRRVRDDVTGEWSLALRFVEVPAAQHGRLDDLLARTAVGPTSTLVESPPERLALWLRGLFASRSERASAEFARDISAGVGPETLDDPPLPDRRRGIRGRLDAEVVTLDESRHRVKAVLIGRDLSLLGMRVDPHPEFVIGRRMIVAFFDSVGRGTLKISAEIVRDDGDRGMGIRFVGMDAETAARLGQLVAALPVVESLSSPGRSLMAARIRSVDVLPPEPPSFEPVEGPSVEVCEEGPAIPAHRAEADREADTGQAEPPGEDRRSRRGRRRRRRKH